MDGICDEINHQWKGKYDHMYQKAQQFGGRTTSIIRIFGIEENQDNSH